MCALIMTIKYDAYMVISKKKKTLLNSHMQVTMSPHWYVTNWMRILAEWTNHSTLGSVDEKLLHLFIKFSDSKSYGLICEACTSIDICVRADV